LEALIMVRALFIQTVDVGLEEKFRSIIMKCKDGVCSPFLKKKRKREVDDI